MSFNDLISSASDILSSSFGEQCRVIFSDGTSKTLLAILTPKEDELSINENMLVIDYKLELSFKSTDILYPDEVELIVYGGKEYGTVKHDFRTGFVKFYLRN